MTDQNEGSGGRDVHIDDETQPLLPYKQPYCPPPAPLSPEDIAQRRRSLGIESTSTGADALSFNSTSFEAGGLAGSGSGGYDEQNSADRQPQQRVRGMYDERGCVEDSCIVAYCC
ncbi:hypothetical protein LPJ59_003750 [Coemansia sp. RSA 2399]|nr:hypothetical protein LPJ59_003750 [Coemansia sp. RSA 2399]KAJ1902770.1 hypothetical protein LPJ81_003420 [Coemansia sp. IMI 209127]